MCTFVSLTISTCTSVQFFSKEDDDEGCLYGEVECIDVGRR